MSTASKIRQARLSKGWSQDEFARELGVSVRNVSRWELGQVKPRPNALRRLAEVLGCSIGDLLPEPDAEAATARALETLAATLMAALQSAIRENRAPAGEPERYRIPGFAERGRPWADPTLNDHSQERENA